MMLCNKCPFTLGSSTQKNTQGRNYQVSECRPKAHHMPFPNSRQGEPGVPPENVIPARLRAGQSLGQGLGTQEKPQGHKQRDLGTGATLFSTRVLVASHRKSWPAILKSLI